jgi:hypothetical protein
MSSMTEEWVSFWVQALSANLEYGSYCSAREMGDTARCEVLEARFDRIAEIYEDFGHVDGIDGRGIASPQWKAWFGPRKHLFMLEPTEILAPRPPIQRESVLQLAIPLAATPEETSATVLTFLRSFYATYQVKQHTPAKYQLQQRRGRIACGYEKVRQACLMASVSYTFDENFEYRKTIKEVVLEFLKHEIDVLGWSMSSNVRNELMTRGTMDVDTYENYRVMIDKSRREFRNLSANTIFARFPDDSKPTVTVDVMDQFWGE